MTPIIRDVTHVTDFGNKQTECLTDHMHSSKGLFYFSTPDSSDNVKNLFYSETLLSTSPKWLTYAVVKPWLFKMQPEIR